MVLLMPLPSKNRIIFFASFESTLVLPFSYRFTLVVVEKRLLNGCSHTRLHTHPFNGPLSGTTQVSRYQKGKTNLDFTEARDSEWQWHQLGHMQICTSLQTGNHVSTLPLSFYRPDALPAAQPTASKQMGVVIVVIFLTSKQVFLQLTYGVFNAVYYLCYCYCC